MYSSRSTTQLARKVRSSWLVIGDKMQYPAASYHSHNLHRHIDNKVLSTHAGVYYNFQDLHNGPQRSHASFPIAQTTGPMIPSHWQHQNPVLHGSLNGAPALHVAHQPMSYPCISWRPPVIQYKRNDAMVVPVTTDSCIMHSHIGSSSASNLLHPRDHRFVKTASVMAAIAPTEPFGNVLLHTNQGSTKSVNPIPSLLNVNEGIQKQQTREAEITKSSQSHEGEKQHSQEQKSAVSSKSTVDTEKPPSYGRRGNALCKTKADVEIQAKRRPDDKSYNINFPSRKEGRSGKESQIHAYHQSSQSVALHPVSTRVETTHAIYTKTALPLMKPAQVSPLRLRPSTEQATESRRMSEAVSDQAPRTTPVVAPKRVLKQALKLTAQVASLKHALNRANGRLIRCGALPIHQADYMECDALAGNSESEQVWQEGEYNHLSTLSHTKPPPHPQPKRIPAQQQCIPSQQDTIPSDTVEKRPSQQQSNRHELVDVQQQGQPERAHGSRFQHTRSVEHISHRPHYESPHPASRCIPHTHAVDGHAKSTMLPGADAAAIHDSSDTKGSKLPHTQSTSTSSIHVVPALAKKRLSLQCSKPLGHFASLTESQAAKRKSVSTTNGAAKCVVDNKSKHCEHSPGEDYPKKSALSRADSDSQHVGKAGTRLFSKRNQRGARDCDQKSTSHCNSTVLPSFGASEIDFSPSLSSEIRRQGNFFSAKDKSATDIRSTSCRVKKSHGMDRQCSVMTGHSSNRSGCNSGPGSSTGSQHEMSVKSGISLTCIPSSSDARLPTCHPSLLER